jgi:phosphatidylglycerophosphate synthase
MKSINELRSICQTTRPSIFTDFLSRFYYRTSIYFTYVCILIGLSANQVTLLSGLVACLGGLLLASSDPMVVLFGVVCFHLFAILDMSDGEVARYRSEGGASGHFLDWMMHFVSSTALMTGLFFSSLDALSGFLMLLAILAILIPVFDKSISASTWTVVAWTRLRSQRREEQATHIELKQPKLRERSIVSRRMIFLMTCPLQDHWLPVLLLFASLADVAFLTLGLHFVDYRLFLLIYIGIVGLPYLSLRIFRIMKGDALAEGHRRLFSPGRPVTLPEDDFLG